MQPVVVLLAPFLPAKVFFDREKSLFGNAHAISDAGDRGSKGDLAGTKC